MPKPREIAKSIKRDLENQWADMRREVFQVTKRNEFQNIIFCDECLIGFCFLTQSIFIRKISIDENLRTYGKWHI